MIGQLKLADLLVTTEDSFESNVKHKHVFLGS